MRTQDKDRGTTGYYKDGDKLVREYKLSKGWLGDSYLVNPNGTKLCKSCETTKFTSDFPNTLNYVDRKLPNCTDCHNKTVELQPYNVDKICRTCKTAKDLAMYSVIGTSNKRTLPYVSNDCKDCSKMSDRVVHAKAGTRTMNDN